MNNPIYTMMITNAKNHIKSENQVEGRRITAFEISEVLAICLCKAKEDVFFDIVNRPIEEK